MKDATPKSSAPLSADAVDQVASEVGDLRPPLGLQELLGILTTREVLTAERAKDIEMRSATLRSRVLKERVGSVRSQAA